MPKLIGPTTHGIIDYAHAALFATLALAWRRSNKPAASAALGTAAFILAQSLLTDYPLGVQPVISFETHGTMDAVFASSSWAIPRLFGFNDTAAAEFFKINSLVESAVVGLTDFDSKRARAEQA